MNIDVGREATIDRNVTESDTASSLGSGDVDVLATPAVVAVCEAAAVRAVADALAPGETTVGVRIDLEHLAPTLPGTDVTARAVVVAVDGRRIEFEVEATDPGGTIARGTHSRVLVDRDRFVQSARSRT